MLLARKAMCSKCNGCSQPLRLASTGKIEMASPLFTGRSCAARHPSSPSSSRTRTPMSTGGARAGGLRCTSRAGRACSSARRCSCSAIERMWARAAATGSLRLASPRRADALLSSTCSARCAMRAIVRLRCACSRRSCERRSGTSTSMGAGDTAPVRGLCARPPARCAGRASSPCLAASAAAAAARACSTRAVHASCSTPVRSSRCCWPSRHRMLPVPQPVGRLRLRTREPDGWPR
mmetsp:Transcript_11105/g.24234  ORF Transcript_11105/g.24234 Transcript_11105/m.24234 type:complete len:236 (+) Transcript_11105:228-935(+)